MGYYLGTGIVSGDGTRREFWERFKANKEFSGYSRYLGASSTMLINLISELEEKPWLDFKFVNDVGLKAL